MQEPATFLIIFFKPAGLGGWLLDVVRILALRPVAEGLRAGFAL